MNSTQMINGVIAALSGGWPMPNTVEHLRLHWALELAPGEGDSIDELHYLCEVFRVDSRVYLRLSARSLIYAQELAVRELDDALVAALIARWPELFRIDYAGEFDRSEA